MEQNPNKSKLNKIQEKRNTERQKERRKKGMKEGKKGKKKERKGKQRDRGREEQGKETVHLLMDPCTNIFENPTSSLVIDL